MVVYNDARSYACVLHVANFLNKAAATARRNHKWGLLLDALNLSFGELIACVSVVSVVMNHAHDALTVGDVAEVCVTCEDCAVFEARAEAFGRHYLKAAEHV